MSRPIVVVAELHARPEHADALAEALTAMILPSRAEEGCLGYDLHRQLDDATTFVIYERWTSARALEDHFRSPHFLDLVPRLDTWLDREMTVRRLTAPVAG